MGVGVAEDQGCTRPVGLADTACALWSWPLQSVVGVAARRIAAAVSIFWTRRPPVLGSSSSGRGNCRPQSNRRSRLTFETVATPGSPNRPLDLRQHPPTVRPAGFCVAFAADQITADPDRGQSNAKGARGNRPKNEFLADLRWQVRRPGRWSRTVRRAMSAAASRRKLNVPALMGGLDGRRAASSSTRMHSVGSARRSSFSGPP